MIDAARRWKAWATAGCAEAPAQNHKLVLAQHQHGMAEQIQRIRGEGPVQRDRSDQAHAPQWKGVSKSASRRS
ncbi:MAG TPA: hypothetical protein PK614_04410 [Nitrospira sp.]|nr:hypothetical protein [Nitrospira sp.]